MKDEIYLAKIGSRVKKLREDKKLTQSELAYKMEIDDSSLRKIESGRVNSTVCTLKKVADSLEISLSELLDFK